MHEKWPAEKTFAEMKRRKKQSEKNKINKINGYANKQN